MAHHRADVNAPAWTVTESGANKREFGRLRNRFDVRLRMTLCGELRDEDDVSIRFTEDRLQAARS
jgi:hypothetical protein